MFYLKECDNWVNKIEDLRGNISDNIYDFIEYLIKNIEENYIEQIEDIKYEMDAYEEQTQEYRYLLSDRINDINELEKMMEQKRWNKSKIIDLVDSIKNSLMTEEIEDTKAVVDNAESNYKYMLSLEDRIKEMNKEIEELKRENKQLKTQFKNDTNISMAERDKFYTENFNCEYDEFDDEIPF